MEKPKRWQLFTIAIVLLLTLYNILPTVFYYSQPLKSPIDQSRSVHIAEEIVNRVNSLEQQSLDWLKSFTKLLGIKPKSIELKDNDPGQIELAFKSSEDADMFRRFLPRAGAMVPFVPAQLELNPLASEDPLKVVVARQINIRLNDNEIPQLFEFSKKSDEGSITPLYKEVSDDRAAQILRTIAGTSRTAQLVQTVIENTQDQSNEETVLSLATEIVEIRNTFGADNPIAKRYFSTYSQIKGSPEESIQRFARKLESSKSRQIETKENLLKSQEETDDQNTLTDSSFDEQIALINSKIEILTAASQILKKNMDAFQSGKTPLTKNEIHKKLKTATPLSDEEYTVDLEGYDPFIQSLILSWRNDSIELNLYQDVQELREKADTASEWESFKKEKLNHYIFNTIARISRSTDESITPKDSGFAIKLDRLPDTKSILALNLGYLAKKQADQLYQQIDSDWVPSHDDLRRDVYPIYTYEEFQTLKPEDKKLGLVIYAPAAHRDAPAEGFNLNSIYVIARGLENVVEKYRANQDDSEAQLFLDEFNRLNNSLQRKGFVGYPGSAFRMPQEYSQDYIFELRDYYNMLLKASRENFVAKGSKRYAVLDFSDVEQRILTRNKIDDQIQEDLLKWQENYNTAQVDLNATSRYTVPAPTQNPYLQNLLLSFKKYFRGDDRKILKLGLDLSGGKTVRIGLRDKNNRPVTNPEDLKQVVNELYRRINNLGVSERTIRIENENIVLEFPGSQALSATELVKASAMYFHVINEKFSHKASPLSRTANEFLQEVWNEAVITNRKDSQSINEIAWQHFGGTSEGSAETALRPRSEHAKFLYENGLRLANPYNHTITDAFDDTTSSIAVMQGDDSTQWQEQTHPLLFVFHNYALEGSSLENIQAGYDPSEGNILLFGVKRSYESKSGSPREDFYAWTSQFAEDRITGTQKEAYSHGEGWRMAVILNGSIITSPRLSAALRDNAKISGRFSQREVNQLAADLKAGSLSFTPRILSEENVSPELGKEERVKGIVASLISLALVVMAMVGYYRFAGFVASCAVLLNIFIMWGVLQNIDAALTLPGIAAIVLTIGMAVDANVLVFERVREEFAQSGRIASAIQAGYRKAFSAIFDSNITTIIAALILIQFDSGPIKGFAVILIIGILSSMFTALFMTRYFFGVWVQNPKNKSLTMSRWIQNTNINFLGKAKTALIASLILIVGGTYLMIEQRKTMFGMDFSGGYSLTVNLQEQPEIEKSYRLRAIDAMIEAGASVSDFGVRELSKPTQLRLQFGTSMEEKGHPFYQMPEDLIENKFAYDFQQNPRIVWIVNALAEAGLEVQPSELANLDKNWSVVSGQFSDTMRNQALMGLALALICILIYITIRFEFKYAVGAVIGLAHDVLITIAVLAIFHALGFPVQIDMVVVGALMTIIGYSLNDTIIVFDRIREDLKLYRKMSFYDAINHALNITLSRTLMTSGTTLLVLISLVLFGGSSLFAFSLVMTIGVVFGTLSTFFIAAPALLYFHNREDRASEAQLKKL